MRYVAPALKPLMHRGARGVQAALFQHFYPEAGAACVRRFTEGLEASLGERRVSMALLQVRLAVSGVPLEPEIHGADPESGSTLRLLQGFSVKMLGQLANFGSTL